MRDNGLPAQEWTHVADLDPPVADAALDALRQAGVAAYATPHPGRAGPYLDVLLPDRPTDQLYVESSARERAVAVLAELHRGDDDATSDDESPSTRSAETAAIDAAFARIVSQFGQPSADPRPYSVEPEPAEGDRDGGQGGQAGEGSGRVLRGAIGWDDLLGERDRPGLGAPDTDSSSDDEGYVPPPPPPVPHGTPVRRFAWLAVLGAPLVVVLCVIVDYRLDGWAGLLVVGAFLGGLGTLFATLDDRPPDEDGPDHGAVV
jgi:hypothetical protein